MENEEPKKNKLKNILNKIKSKRKVNYEKVVKKMDDSEEQYKIVTENMDKIIEQDKVRDTLKYIEDEKVEKIVKEQKKKLKDNQKISFAIMAIGDNQRKMKELLKNYELLSDIEIAEILNTFKPEKSFQMQKERENQKINLISFKITENLIKYGSAWHLEELTSCFDDESKVAILKRCLGLLYHKGKNKNVSSDSKVKFVYNLLQTLNGGLFDKSILVNKYLESNFLNANEIQILEQKLQSRNIAKNNDTQELEI